MYIYVLLQNKLYSYIPPLSVNRYDPCVVESRDDYKTVDKLKKKETAFAKKKKTGRETDGKGGKSDEGLGEMEGRGVTYLTDH